MTVDELKSTYVPGYNVGFRPGKWSVVDGSEICVLDVDIRGGPAFAAQAYAAAQQILGDAHFDVISGSVVGRHRYLRFPARGSPNSAATTLTESDLWVDPKTGKYVAPKSKGNRPAWTVELLSTGKNVVLPPSIHPDTNQRYRWSQP